MQNYHLLRALGEGAQTGAVEARACPRPWKSCCLARNIFWPAGNYIGNFVANAGIRTFETYTRNTFDLAQFR